MGTLLEDPVARRAKEEAQETLAEEGWVSEEIHNTVEVVEEEATTEVKICGRCLLFALLILPVSSGGGGEGYAGGGGGSSHSFGISPVFVGYNIGNGYISFQLTSSPTSQPTSYPT